MIDEDRMELLAQVAEMYYVEDLNQAAIAKELFFSRSKVSRLLTEAREAGLVEVTIKHSLRRDSDLERQISEKYQIDNALILKSWNYSLSLMLRTLGRLAAKYIDDHLEDGSTIGISWGTAVFEIANGFRPRNLKNFQVIQVIGSIGTGDPAIDGPEVARQIAANYSGKYFTLNAPVIVNNKNTRDGLLKERKIHDVIEKANRADIIVAGIGSSDPGRSGLVRAGYLLGEEMIKISQETGAVGDICACLFNQDGEYQNIHFNDRVVGISLDQIKASPAEVIGIAGGEEKAEAILGALRGNLINTLITDDKAAERILKID
jgi:DNA-binding transcriptional regulator LsrR (DeoR family)